MNGQACRYAAELLQTNLALGQVDAESSSEVVAVKPIMGESGQPGVILKLSKPAEIEI
jgi:hypothetical protein